METIDLSDFFYTKSQANNFLMHLSEIAESIYEVSFDLEKELIKHFGIQKKDKFIVLFRDNKVNIYSIDELKQFLQKIQKTVSSLPVLSMVIAFEPNEETLKMLSEWVVMNLHKEALFDIKIDPKIIGGATISFNGKYTDLSIKTKFDQIFQETIINKPTALITPQVMHQTAEHMQIGR